MKVGVGTLLSRENLPARFSFAIEAQPVFRMLSQATDFLSVIVRDTAQAWSANRAPTLPSLQLREALEDELALCAFLRHIDNADKDDGRLTGSPPRKHIHFENLEHT